MIFAFSVPLHPTPLLTLWTLFLFLFLLFRYKNYFVNHTYPRLKLSKKIPFLTIGVVLFTMTCFCNGDFFHSISFVEGTTIEQDFSENSHYEFVYQWLAVFSNGNYWLWRFYIWGGMCFLVALTAKRFDVDYRLTFYVMFVMFAVWYSFGRSDLALSIYFFGLSFLVKPTGKYSLPLSYAIGISIMLISPFFHRSMWGLVAITPVIFFPNLITKKDAYYRMVTFIVLLIVGVVVVVGGMLYFWDLSFLDKTGQTQEMLLMYGEGSGYSIFHSPSYFVTFCFQTINFLGVAILLSNALVKNEAKGFQDVQNLFKYYLAMVVASYVLYFMGPSFWSLHFRLLIMLAFPVSFLVSRVWTLGLIDLKTFRRILLLGIVDSFWMIGYAWYCTWAHGTIY